MGQRSVLSYIEFMKDCHWLSCLLILVGGNLMTNAAQESDYLSLDNALLPRPQYLIVQDGTYLLDSEAAIITTIDPALSLAPEGYATLPSELAEQGYILKITQNDISLHARSQQGAFYGMATLHQIWNWAMVHNDNQLPALLIHDWPAIQLRGYHEDYGRDQLPTMEAHRNAIRKVANAKMNTYLWYIEPDHFVYDFDPNISPEYDRFTLDEIRELVAYAKEYHVDIIPVIQLLGHMEQLLRHERYEPLAEMPGGGGDLAAASDEAFDLVRNIISELAPVFDSQYFHAGLDESFTIGQGRSASAVEELGISQVFANYYNRVNDEIASHGKTMMMYADIVMSHPGLLDMLGPDIVLMFWDYLPSQTFDDVPTISATGRPFTVLSGLWDWANLYPVYKAGFTNIENLTSQGMEYNALGAFVSSWGDPYRGGSGTNFSELNDYGVIYKGAYTWNPAAIDFDTFSKSFALQHFGIATPAVAEALSNMAQVQDLAYNTWPRRILVDPMAQTVLSMVNLDDASLAYWQKLKADTASASTILKNADAKRNEQTLQAIIMAAEMLELAADMALLGHQIGQQSEDIPAELLESLLVNLGSLAERHRGMAEKYADVWRASNRPLQLDRLMPHWEEGARGIEAFARLLREGSFPPDQTQKQIAFFNFGTAQPYEQQDGSMVLEPYFGSAQILREERNAAQDITQYLHLPADAALRGIDNDRILDVGMTPFLVEAWVRNPGQNEQTWASSIIYYGAPGQGWRLGIDHENQLRFTISGVLDLPGPNALIPCDGQWYHVAVAFRQCRYVDYYVNGELKDQRVISGFPASPDISQLVLGNELNGMTPFEGDLAAIRISKGDWQPGDVKQLMEAGLPKTP